jgi:dipeptidyl-peptidase 4
VYEEELGVRDAFRWSPDGTHIAYWQFDSTGVGMFSLINNTDTLYPVITRIPYPKAGTTNSAVRIGVVPARRRQDPLDETPGDPRDSYLARMEWLDTARWSSSSSIGCRTRTTCCSPTRGRRRARVFRDESKGWVDVADDTPWIDDGRAFLWVSERDGWRHAYRVRARRRRAPAAGADALRGRRLDIAGMDEAGGWLYVIASPDNATERYLYRARLDGTGTPERVTPADRSRDAQLRHCARRPSGVPHLVAVRCAARDRRRRPARRTARCVRSPTSRRCEDTLAPSVQPPVEFFTVDIGGGVTLDGWMLKPSHFDASKRYPVIVYVYGEPASQTVTRPLGRRAHALHRALAEAGYVVVSVDNRGTPAPKGRDWRKVVYGSVGDLSSREQDAACARWWPAQRISMAHGSASGAGAAAGRTPSARCSGFRDVFSVGVSVAPVPDQALYDTIYQERYMGLPQDNAEGYRIGSPINFAEGLTGRLLHRARHRRRQRALPGHRAADEPARRARQAVRRDGLPEPHARHRGRPRHDADVYRRIGRYFLEHLPPGP